MDEYSFENYQNFHESDNFSDIFLNEFEVEQKIISQHLHFQKSQLQQSKDDTFATNLTTSVPQSDIQKPQYNETKESTKYNYQRSHRIIRTIETSNRVDILNRFTFSGSKNDTVELNTNFKTLFKKFLRENIQEKAQIGSKQLLEFERGVSSFKSFSQLYDSNEEIKDLCSKLIRSSKIIKRVMNSRAKFWMRLQMVKYIEALNLNLNSDKLVRWKSIRKDNV